MPARRKAGSGKKTTSARKPQKAATGTAKPARPRKTQGSGFDADARAEEIRQKTPPRKKATASPSGHTVKSRAVQKAEAKETAGEQTKSTRRGGSKQSTGGPDADTNTTRRKRGSSGRDASSGTSKNTTGRGSGAGTTKKTTGGSSRSRADETSMGKRSVGNRPGGNRGETQRPTKK